MIRFNRQWSMPSRHTFLIKPIAELLARWVPEGGLGWIDPFAGWNSPAQYTNDLNPDAPTTAHLDARDFVRGFPPGSLDGVLFDPPYTSRQVAECYRGFGREVTAEDTRATFWSTVKDLAAPTVRPGGTVISFGYNTMGFGKNRGFKIVEILLVPHGGPHHDTLVTVERKTS